MGKKSRKQKKNSRDVAKRQRRAANQAKYAAWRDQGVNQKSRRVKIKAKNKRKNQKKAKRIRSKTMSAVPKKDGTFMTQRQAKNQMSWKQFMQQVS